MGIKLDWQIDSEDELTRVEEDSRVVAARERRTKHFRNLIIFVVIVSLVSGGLAIRRLQKAATQRRTELEALVATEAAAVRIGDQNTFLSHQGQDRGWLQFQTGVFDEYQALGDRLSIDGEILEINVDANLGRVVLRETLDGEPYQVVWFYEYIPDDGWQHVPPITRLMGRIQYLETEHFEFFYRNADGAYAQALAEQLEAWIGDVSRQMPSISTPRMTIFIVTEPTHHVSWEMGHILSLNVPSPATSRTRAVAPLEDPTLRGELVEELTWQLATMTLGNAIAAHSDAAWMRDEVANWLAAELDETHPGSEVMTALIDVQGSEFTNEWLRRVQEGDPVLPTLSLLSGNVLYTLPIVWEDFFEHRLIFELNPLDRQSNLQRVMGNYDSDAFTPPTVSSGSVVAWHEIQIETIYRGRSNTWWVESSTHQIGHPRIPLTLLTEFSEVEGDWVMTSPEPEDWHSPQQLCGAHVCIHYFTLDAPFASDLLPILESTYVQSFDDLAPALPERQIAVMIVPSMEAAANLEVSPDAIQVLVLSPFAVRVISAPSTQAYLQEASVDGMVSAWIQAAVQPLPEETSLVQAFVNWELARLGGEEVSPAYPEIVSEESSDLYSSDPFSLSEYHDEGAIMDEVAAWTLLAAIEAHYGGDVMGPLLVVLPQAADMESWLATVDGSPEDILPLWEELLIQALNQTP